MRRRDFLKSSGTAGAAAFTAASADRIHGANSRVNVALIGCGGRGKRVAGHIDAVDGVDYIAMCDVYDAQAENAKAEFGGKAKTYRDFRRVLENKDVDAIHVATPDHWHAIPTVMGLEAGKHVYVEKPFAHNILEGKAMVKASKEHPDLVFLTGTQHRSASHFVEVQKMIQEGQLANVHFVRIWNYANLMPDGIGEKPDSDPPEGLDWDFYLGPAPWVRYNPLRHLRTYRFFYDYAGGWITDFGTHRFDTVHQVMGVDAPKTVCAAGGRFAVGGMGDQPDILQVTYEYPGFVVSYETINTNRFGAIGRLTPGLTHHGARGEENRPNGMAFYGSNGAIFADRRAWEVVPEDEPPRRRGFTERGDRGPKLKRRAENADEASALHGQHFIRCIRDGEKPRCDAVVGHRSSLIGHLGNIAYKTGHKLRWDAKKQDFIDDKKASSLLGRKARKPWDLI